MIFALALAAGVSLTGPAGAESVRGKVLDEASERPISFAEITLLAADATIAATTLADSLGVFSLVARPGTYRLRVQRIGYTTVITDPLVLKQGENVAVELRLAPLGIPLDPLIVTARGGLEPGRFGFARRCALGRGVCLDRDSIALREPIAATDAFHGVPGIVVMDQIRCLRTVLCDPVVTNMRGGKCLLIYVDHGAKAFAFGLPVGSDAATDPRAGAPSARIRAVRKPASSPALAGGGAGLN